MTDSVEIIRKDLRTGRLLKQEAQQQGIDLTARGNTFTYSSTIGAAQYSDLQDAIDAAAAAVAGGGTVVVLNGTHIQTADITLASNIRLIGQDVLNTFISFGAGDYNISATSLNNITIENISFIDSTKATAMVLFTLTNNVIIERCNFDVGDGTNSNVKFDRCDNISFTLNTIESNATYGVYVTGGAGDNVSINNNTFRVDTAVYAYNCGVTFIQNNYIETTGATESIKVEQSGASSAKVDISDNYILISGNPTYVIKILGASGSEINGINITSNKIYCADFSSPTNGIYLEYCRKSAIIGNIVENDLGSFAADGIVLATNTLKCTVVGNVTTEGITDSGTSNQVASNVTS